MALQILIIRGSTSMDNLNMHEIMKKLGIDTEKVEWGEY